jgi:hypothetical protein
VPQASASASEHAAAPSDRPASHGAFDVDEWGLIDVRSPSNAALMAGPPSGPTNWNAPRRKPVLYFHLDDATASLDATVTVTTASMGFAEHFPKGDLSADGSTLTWRGLHIAKAHCHVVGAPTRESPECHTSDGLCEAAELGRYETADASCIEMAHGSFNHLFYRANGTPPPLPFDVVVQGNQLSITHSRASDVVGPIIYVHNETGAVTVSTLAPPALGKSLVADPPKETDLASARAALDKAMESVGLTRDEAAAFDRAWDNDLFGRDAARDAPPARRAWGGPEDYLLFAMPASLVNGISTVTIVPAPRALRRFILVRLRV